MRGEISVSCNPSTNITAPTAKVKKPNTVPLSANADPITPITPPSTINAIIRPRLKYRWGLNFWSGVCVGWFSAYLEATLSTRPPINAMQVENPAVKPITSAMVPLLPPVPLTALSALSKPKIWNTNANPVTTKTPIRKSFHTRSLRVRSGFVSPSSPTS